MSHKFRIKNRRKAIIVLYGQSIFSFLSFLWQTSKSVVTRCSRCIFRGKTLKWREQYRPVREWLTAIKSKFFGRRERCESKVFYCLLTGFFLGVVSASSARRKFWRWREQYKWVRERLAKTFNVAIGVLTTSKNGGYALIRTGDPIIMSDVL